MNRTKMLLATSMSLEGLFALLCVVPLPEQINPFNATRIVSLCILTLLIFSSGMIAAWLSLKGYMLREVALCLIMILPIHLVAAGAQESLIWLPITFGFASLAITIKLSWQNS